MWRRGQIEFHQSTVHPFLPRFWPRYGQPEHQRVFVPMCGKSHDIMWLAQRGHPVVGVELSAIAVKAFFRYYGITPKKSKVGGLTCWQSQNITLFCGDYFELTSTILGEVNCVFDRAALTALPGSLRQHYISHLTKLLPAMADIFLLTVEDFSTQSEQAQVNQVDGELQGLFGREFMIHLAHIEMEKNIHLAHRSAPALVSGEKLYQIRYQKA